MHILSVDPSLSSTGWSVLDKDTKELINFGKISTTNKMEEDERIYLITMTLIDICTKYDIIEVVSESQYVANNPRTGMQLSRLRGGIAVGFKMKGLKLSYKAPSTVKKVVTGRGDATKEEVVDSLDEIYGEDELYKTIGPFNDKTCKAKTSDIYDAIAIGYSYCEG